MAMSDSVATAAAKALCFELSGTIPAGFGTPRGDSYVVLNALAWVVSTVVARLQDSAGTRAMALDYFMRALAANLAKDSDDLIRIPPPQT
jgi:hypothetical protein